MRSITQRGELLACHSLADVPDRTGGYGPLAEPRGFIGVAYDSVVEDILVPAGTIAVLPRNVAGDPIECSFPSWKDNDVLEVDYDVTPIADNSNLTPATAVAFLAIVSVDGGATFQILLPSQTKTTAGAPSGALPATARACVALVIPGTTPPIVQLIYTSDGDFDLAGVTLGVIAGSAHLKCTRITPDTIDGGPTGVLVDVGP